MTTQSHSIHTKDLTKGFPRSPRETLAGYVIAARMLDKCRAVIAGCAGEYHYNCPLDRNFFDFTGIDADEFKAFVATGASDEEVVLWIEQHSKITQRSDIVIWNNKLRDLRQSEAPVDIQVFLEDYVPQFTPKHRPVYTLFDVFDLEEKRI